MNDSTRNFILYFLKLIVIGILFAPFYARINYEHILNPDINNYLSNYRNADWSYEIGYEYLSHFFREYLRFDFNDFWSSLIIIQLILLIFIYRKKIEFIICLPNLYLMSEYFYGTTVRYSIGCLLFILFIRQGKMVYLRFITPVFHYGIFIISILDLFKNIIIRRLTTDVVSKQLFNIFFMLTAAFLTGAVVNIVLPYTRFAYYASSFYLEAKSISSTIYILISLILIIVAVYYDEKLRSDELIKLALSVLVFCFVTSGVAVLSGRTFQFYLLLEPILITKMIYSTRVRSLGLLLLLIYSSKLVLFAI
ncbi:EpsG family protein [Vibrio chagasii]|uniref:EpsG family protein n=1 Tax=Vibrio chagasii TaxID=170679 RepID=UPI0016417EB7